MPHLVLVVHHPEEMGANLMIAYPLHHGLCDLALCDVHHILLVRRGLHHIRGSQHVLHNADLDLVFNVVLPEVLRHNFTQVLVRDLFLAVEPLHEGLGASVLVLHALQYPLCLRQQLEADVAVLLEVLRHILLWKGVREDGGNLVAAREEGLHRLLQVRRPEAQKQRGPRVLRPLLRLRRRLGALGRGLGLGLPRPRELLKPRSSGLRGLRCLPLSRRGAVLGRRPLLPLCLRLLR
mmetsp:Transcript_7717/g.22640  ORF Transcript_7717/g.22640 Transcript_7717/m.22640 type:complete len:236 (-) Transcript_7717:29-736(-)